MMNKNNASNILTILEYKGIGKAWIVDNYNPNMSEKEIVDRLQNELAKSKKDSCSRDDFMWKKERISRDLERLSESISSQFGSGYTAFGDDDFPLLLQQSNKNLLFDENIYKDSTKRILNMPTSEYPVFLTYQGDLGLLKSTNMNIAVIGLLNPSEEIQEIEKKIVDEFINNEAIIVSGLALGCDSIAHKQAVNRDYPTIAILPSPINSILPKKNTELAREIVTHGGLLISEYYNEVDFRVLASRYVERDRLQAAFSDMVVLTASYTQEDTKKDKKCDSGSRHAMEKAKKYNIKRAVIYDEVFEKYKDNECHLNRMFIDEYCRHNNIKEAISMINKREKDFKVITLGNVKNIAQGMKKYCDKKFNKEQK